MKRGWRDIGYQYVITNGFALDSRYYQEELDGQIEQGRPFDGDNYLSRSETGAHALGLNAFSIGICLIGIDRFSLKQSMALCRLINRLIERHGLKISDVIGHYETDNANGKTCPNLDMNALRAIITSFSR